MKKQPRFIHLENAIGFIDGKPIGISTTVIFYGKDGELERHELRPPRITLPKGHLSWAFDNDPFGLSGMYKGPWLP